MQGYLWLYFKFKASMRILEKARKQTQKLTIEGLTQTDYAKGCSLGGHPVVYWC